MTDLRVVVITGLSGAGKTAASRVLEDIGFYVVDNLPPALIPTFVDLCRSSDQIDRAALVVDVRGGEFFPHAVAALADLQSRGVPHQILFLEADDDTLIQRYKESRRQHPMAPHGRIADGIARERRRLQPLRARAHQILDTSRLRQAELRAALADTLAPGSERLGVTLLSFGFKHGVPPDADIVLDVRWLPNPHYVPELRPHSGLDPQVAAFVLGQSVTRRFLELTYPWLDFMLPHCQREGRLELVVAVGCTGGRHRSVVVAQALADHFRGAGRTVAVTHRDCDRVAEAEAAEAGEPPPA